MPDARKYASALIDHHATNPAFADVNLIDGDAAATGVMVVELMERLRIPLTPSMAENLYVGITTDTGNFSYPSTDGRTLRAGAKCLDAGADPDEITRRMFRTPAPWRALNCWARRCPQDAAARRRQSSYI